MPAVMLAPGCSRLSSGFGSSLLLRPLSLARTGLRLQMQLHALNMPGNGPTGADFNDRWRRWLGPTGPLEAPNLAGMLLEGAAPPESSPAGKAMAVPILILGP